MKAGFSLLGAIMKKEKTLNDKIADADMRGGYRLALGNEHAEAGRHKQAEECYDKGQYWLDRSNKLRGNH